MRSPVCGGQHLHSQLDVNFSICLSWRWFKLNSRMFYVQPNVCVETRKHFRFLEKCEGFFSLLRISFAKAWICFWYFSLRLILVGWYAIYLILNDKMFKWSFKNKKKFIHSHYFSLSSKLQAFNHKPLNQTFWRSWEIKCVQTLQRMIQMNDSKRGTVRTAEWHEYLIYTIFTKNMWRYLCELSIYKSLVNTSVNRLSLHILIVWAESMHCINCVLKLKLILLEYVLHENTCYLPLLCLWN